MLGPRRVKTRLLLVEHAGHLEYQPFGVVGVIGPWNYPILTPLGPISGALAAGNAVVFKPSEYTPAVGQWLVDTFAEVVPEQPVLQAVHGLGEVGAALCRSGVGKIAFTGSTATAKKVMATCAETLTPVVLEAGGKDALIVDADADIPAAAEAAVWGAMTNAGQTCIGIERVYAVAPVYDGFVAAVTEKASALRTGEEIGPITMPGQIDVIRRHIDDALSDGGRAVLGGNDAVQPPYVSPTVLVDVPESSSAIREETFGPTLTITKVADADEAVEKANAVAVRAGRRGLRQGERDPDRPPAALRHGGGQLDADLRRHGQPAVRRGRRLRLRPHPRRGRAAGVRPGQGDHGTPGARPCCPSMTFERTPAQVRKIVKTLKLLYGRRP